MSSAFGTHTNDGPGIRPERVIRARREAGLSQAELADLVGCSPRTVQYWESPGSTTPRSRYVRALAGATGKPIAWFFTEDEEMVA